MTSSLSCPVIQVGTDHQRLGRGKNGPLTKVTPTSEARKVLMTPRRHPRQGPNLVLNGCGLFSLRRTRIFVRMPSGDILPADMDLDWTTTEASEYIIAPGLQNRPEFGTRLPSSLHLADARVL